MANQGADFIKSKRDAGLGDDEIRSKLLTGGWSESEVSAAFSSLDNDIPLPPSQQEAIPPAPAQTVAPQAQPVAVVQQLSTRGVEYGIMFYSLGFGAIALGGLLHSLIDLNMRPRNDSGAFYGGEMLAVQGIIALVTIPIFLFMFLRLKHAEQNDASLHQDTSRRSFIQKTLIIAFIWGIWAFAYNAYQLVTGADSFTAYGNTEFDQGTFVMARILHMLITLAIAGGIFTFFWRDEHKKNPV